MFQLVKQYVTYTDEDEQDVDLGALDAYLGCCSLEGKGCAVDDYVTHMCIVRRYQIKTYFQTL